MKLLLILSLLTLVVVYSHDEELHGALNSPTKLGALFHKFSNSHLRHYSNRETKLRLRIFKKSVEEVYAHNGQGTTWTETLNKFADMTESEKKGYLGLNATHKAHSPDRTLTSTSGRRGVPSAVSWIGKGAITAVKDQMACGSCWTFGATGALEGAYFLSAGVLRNFAEKQILDCTYSYDGCGGGWMKDGINGVVNVNGNKMASTADYPYSPVDGFCHTDKPDSMIGAKIKKYVDVPYGESYTIAALAQHVLTITFYVRSTFQRYKSGIYRDNTHGHESNHALVAVAYTPSYVLIKNSWGADWGDRGYIKVARNYNGCAFHTYVGYVEMYDTGKSDMNASDAATDYDPDTTPAPPVVCEDLTVSCRQSWCHMSYYKNKCRKTCGMCDTGTCPSGTKMCDDGVCRHAHMC